MSSDSERLSKPNKRPRPIVSDSESSDDSFINTNRGKKRVGRLISDRESSDDDSDIPIRSAQRRKAHKLVIEDETSYESSSSSNEGVGTNFEGGSTSSEWESDWESMDEEVPAAAHSVAASSSCKNKCKKTHKSPDKNAPRTSSDSENSDGDSEKCPICLLSFRKQEVANPSSCEHCFCLDCLIEWSKNVNTCPVDRQTFTVINVRAKIGGKIIRHVPIDVKSQEQPAVQEDPTYCEICQRCDREDRMLLCDGCDSGFHLECLDPPMDEVPLEEQWFCPECSRNVQQDAEDIEIDHDEVPDIMEEARRLGVLFGRSRSSLAAQYLTTRRSNMLPRTRQAERVRANVRAGRSRQAAAAAAASSRDQPSTSSGFDSISENSRGRSPAPGTSGLSSAGSRRRKPASRVATTRRKPKRKRATRTTTRRAVAQAFREVRISEINEDGQLQEMVTYVRAMPDGPLPSGRRRKKRKKKGKRARTVASVAAAMKTAKRRLASQLKIKATVAGGNVNLSPVIKNESTPQYSNSKIRVARHSAGIGQVSLFGGGLGLDYSPPGQEYRGEWGELEQG